MRHEEIHIHQRKRNEGKKDLKPYPARDPLGAWIDKIVAVTAIVYPLTLLPQLYTIYSTQSAAGVSLITWSLLLLFTIPLVAYAFFHHDNKLKIMYCAFLVIYVFIVAGIVMYG